MTYFFDSSALVAHAFNQPGASQVQELVEDEKNELFFSALSLFELAAVLKHQGAANFIDTYWETYRQCATVIPVDASLAESAWRLRENSVARIPMADAIIAVSAQKVGATLVHRDQHLAQIPESLVPQRRLPDR